MAYTLGFTPPGPTDLDLLAKKGLVPPPVGGTDAGGQPAANANFFAGQPIATGLTNLNFGQAPTPVAPPILTPTPAPQAGQIDWSKVPTPTGAVPATAGLVPTAQQAAAPAAAQGVTPTAGTATAASVAPPPTIVAPKVSAEQGGFKDFNELQQAIYRSEFDPVQRELTRQQGLADEQLKAQLAKAGLSTSGTGTGQLVRQDQEFYRQMAAAASDASQKAAVTRYGMEYTQSMENAKLRQEANFKNAEMDFGAQVQNATNILTARSITAQLATQASVANAANQTQASIAGAQNQTQANIASMQTAADIAKANAMLGTQASIAGAQNLTSAGIAGAQNQTQASIAGANLFGQLAGQQAALGTQAGIAGANIASAENIAGAQAYLTAMGLNVQQEQQARQSYLQLLGIQETDLARMDTFTLQNTGMLYDTYLKQLAILTQAGQVSFGKTDQSSGSTDIKVGF